MNNTKISYVDLFAGCGGLSYGFQKNNFYKHVIATDIWKHAKTTYQYNFKKKSFLLADLTQDADLHKIVQLIGTGIDIIMGGPPCKGFSTLNNSKKVSKLNTLVDQYLKVVEQAKPNIFLIENVRAFRSKKHPSGLTYSEHLKKKISTFNESYNVAEFILNAGEYGVAQSRIRYFLIATKKSFDSNKSIINSFLTEIIIKKSSKKFVLRDIIKDLPKVRAGEGADIMECEDGKIIYNHKAQNHSKKLLERFRHVPKDGGLMDVPIDLLTNHLKKVVKGEYGSGGFAKNIYGRMNWEKQSGTIVAGMDKITIGRFVHPEEDRLLTPRECARIQSFPDNFRFFGGMVNQYYQIGNAVPPKISILFASILEGLLSGKRVLSRNKPQTI